MLIAGLSVASYERLERITKRNDGRSNVSKDSSWMREPHEIAKGWYLEGCMSLIEKQSVLKRLPEIGLASAEFAKCAQDFVGGESVQKYLPGAEAAARLIERFRVESA